MNSKGVKRYPLSKQVADKLEKMIADGEYAVGEKINTEVELMEIFSVSRNTVREAIQSLTSAGVLEVKQGDGTYVKANNRFDANMSMKYAEVSIGDIRETRHCLEITIAHLAAERRTEEEMKEITECFLRRKGLNQTIKEDTLADINFHIAIAKACHNKILIDLYQSIATYLESQIAERQAETDLDLEEIEQLHEQLYLAIRDRQPETAAVCAGNILKI